MFTFYQIGYRNHTFSYWIKTLHLFIKESSKFAFDQLVQIIVYFDVQVRSKKTFQTYPTKQTAGLFLDEIWRTVSISVLLKCPNIVVYERYYCKEIISFCLLQHCFHYAGAIGKTLTICCKLGSEIICWPHISLASILHVSAYSSMR